MEKSHVTRGIEEKGKTYRMYKSSKGKLWSNKNNKHKETVREKNVACKAYINSKDRHMNLYTEYNRKRKNVK